MTKKITLADAPYAIANYEVADAAAIQALTTGTADEHQQRRAIKWLIEQAANTYQFHYYASERDTAFALGRAFVGQQIVKMQALNVSKMRRDENG